MYLYNISHVTTLYPRLTRPPEQDLRVCATNHRTTAIVASAPAIVPARTVSTAWPLRRGRVRPVSTATEAVRCAVLATATSAGASMQPAMPPPVTVAAESTTTLTPLLPVGAGR